ncbi:MAG: DUF1553 domain-containing protein, partial [Pirellulaceae bacterium]|nr:DUF1553 domain-containing protein [Pirellulaceae bacterium]
QLVDLLPEGPHLDLKENQLPNGSFGIEYCCGRSFQIDNLVIEVSGPATSPADLKAPSHQTKTEYAQELKRRQAEIQATRDQQSKLQGQEPGRIAWVTDTAPAPPDVYLLARGDYAQRTTKVYPAPFSALQDPDNPLPADTAKDVRGSSGRRSAWARWVTHPSSRAAHLMARVQVNRVWQHHFGTGLVSTPENLGMSGSDPSNAMLLDWLAAEFIRSQWSLKALHRSILLSTVARQSSLAYKEGLSVDPGNQLLWRYPMRRLDAEAIRDAQLAVSGELDMTIAGPYTPTTRNGTAEVTVPEDRPGAFRRSIYLQQRRTQGLSLLSVFDAPAMVINCTRRPVTTMPLQSLSLLNSEFAVRRGQQLAKRTQHAAVSNMDQRILTAFMLTTGRPASPSEQTDAREFLNQQQTHYNSEERAFSELCQLLLASNTFLYLE